MVSLEAYLLVASILFAIGLFIALGKRNLISIVMGIEIMLNAINLVAISFARYGSMFDNQIDALAGHVLVIFILTVAAAEAAIGLAIIVVYYRNSGTIRVEEIDKLKG